MDAFDGNAYRKRVLATLDKDFAAADPGSGDVFLVFDLDPEVTDAAAIRSRVDDVVAFWNRELSSPKYKGLVAQLSRRREDYTAVLLDPTSRRAAADRVRARRAAADTARYTDLDRLAGQLAGRFGGIPPDRVPTLRALATRRGLSAGDFAAWLGRHRVLAGATAPAEPWDAAVRRQIRDQLDELARTEDRGDGYPTLWAFLGVVPNASREQVQARHAELVAGLGASRHNRAKTLRGDLLGHVKTRLLAEDGAARYAASLRADARDRIEQDVTEQAVVAGEVSAADYEALVARIVGFGWGLDSDAARAVVRETASGVGVSLAVAPAVDYVLCGACRTPQPAAARTLETRCRYCGEPLFTACPACGEAVETAASVCPRCGESLQAVRAALALTRTAEEHLTAGRPAAAREAGMQARDGLAASRVPAALSRVLARADAALVSAGAEWAALADDESAGRLFGAYDRALRLARSAADVPGGAGLLPEQEVVRLGDRRAGVLAEVDAARRLAPPAAEAALCAILDRVPDAAEAAVALERLPLAPPVGVTASAEGEQGALISWLRSPARGVGGYRVQRVTPGPGGSLDRATVARTSTTSLHDAGAPGGVSLVYEVTAVAGRRASEAAASDPLVLYRDVAALVADPSETSIALRWAAPPGNGRVVIGRTSAADSPLRLTPRRIVPAEHGRHVDADVPGGAVVVYRVSVEYARVAGPPVVTAGRSVTSRLRRPPRPVRDLFAAIRQGRTVVSFTPPAEGEVQVFATAGPAARPLAQPGESVDVTALAARPGVRKVGTGRRRVIDQHAAGRVVYTPVTVGADGAVAGEAVEHVAANPVRNLVARDEGAQIVLTFAMPTGVTEAFVRWREDGYPQGPDDPAASGAKVTNTKLEIAGGFAIPAPPSGGPLYVAVYPAVRVDPSRPVVAVPVAALVAVRG